MTLSKHLVRSTAVFLDNTDLFVRCAEHIQEMLAVNSLPPNYYFILYGCHHPGHTAKPYRTKLQAGESDFLYFFASLSCIICGF